MGREAAGADTAADRCGLVRKSGLVDLTADDRAVLYGAFLEIASLLQDKNREHYLSLWRRRGREAFKSETHVPLVVSGTAALPRFRR